MALTVSDGYQAYVELYYRSVQRRAAARFFLLPALLWQLASCKTLAKTRSPEAERRGTRRRTAPKLP